MAGYLPEMQFMDAAPAIQANVLGTQLGNQEAQQNFLRRTQMQQQDLQRRVGQTAATSGFDAASKVAMAGGDLKTGVDLSNLSLDRQTKMYDFLGRAAIAADTPEKWQEYIGILSKQFGPDSVKGFEDFKSRESAILLSKNAYDAAQQKAASDQFGRALSGGAPPATSQPRGVRNNNPLNIEAGKFTEGLPGFQGSDGRFAKFASVDQGVAAADALLASYGSKGINTVAGVVNRWAPPTENDSNAYAATVAKAIGVEPNAPIDLANPQTRQKLIGAMAQVENGQPLSTPPAAGASFVDRVSPQALIAAMANPALPAGQKEVAKMLLAEKLKTNPEIAKLEVFRRDPGLMQLAIDLKKAGAANVTQNNKGDNAYDVERAKTRAKRADEFQTQGDKAFSTLGSIAIMKQMIADPNFKSGSLAENFILPLKQAVVALGGDPKGAASMEVFRAQANKAVLDSMGGSLGAGFSEGDRKFVVTQAPGLNNTAEGNAMLLNVMEKVERRKIEIAKLAQAYEQEHKSLDAGFDRILTQYRERNALFTPEEKQQIQVITASANDLEAEAKRRGLLK